MFPVPDRRALYPLVFAVLVFSLSSLAFIVPRIAFEKLDRKLLVIVDGRELADVVDAVGLHWQEAASRLKSVGINAVGISRFTLDELDAAGVVSILEGPAGTGFAADNLPGLYLKVGPRAGAYLVERSLNNIVPTERRGNVLHVFSRGAVVRSARLFWRRDRARVFEAAGLVPVHRLYNHLWTGGELNTKLLDGVKPGSLVLFDEKYALGWPDRLSKAARLLASRGLRIGLVEFAGQIGVKELITAGDLSSVVVHSISSKEMLKFTRARFIPRWVRAVRERRVRAVYLRPFSAENPPPGKGNLFQRNLLYFAAVTKALKREGFVAGSPADPRNVVLEPANPALAALARIGLFTAAAAMVALTLVSWDILPPLTAMVLGLVLSFGLASLLLLGKTVLVWKGAALLCAVCAPAGAVGVYSAVLSAAGGGGRAGRLRFAGRALAGLLLFLALCCAGGGLIHGFLGTPEFLLKLDTFSGVKLVYLLPPLFVSAGLLIHNRFRPASSVITWLHVVLLGAAALAGAIYILRSGNFSPIPATKLEHSFRDLLDLALPARPRTKEFLVGYPALVLLAAFVYLKDRWKAFACAVAGTIAGVSVVNSFCHLTCRPDLNVLRSFISLLVGLPIGVALVPVFALFRACPGRSALVVGYYGFDNAGDEILLDRLVPVLRENLPAEDEIVVLVRGGAELAISERLGVKAVNRLSPWAVLPELIRCRTLIYGGGGLFQDTTGFLSVPYYAFFSLAASLLCVERRMFVAQGVGPIDRALSRELLVFTAKRCDFAQTRDEQSARLLKRWGVRNVQTGADLLLWKRPIEDGALPERRARIGVALRPSRHLSPERLAALADVISRRALKKRMRVQLLALQPSFDRPVLEDFARRLDKSVSREFCDVTSADLLSRFARCRVVICMRYHAMLASIVTGTPFFALSYDPKTETLLDTIGWPYREEISSLRKDSLVEGVGELAAHGDRVVRLLDKARGVLLRNGRRAREAFVDHMDIDEC